MSRHPDRPTCRCGKGKSSAWDGKCGHCRTKAEQGRIDYLRSPYALRAEPPAVSAMSPGNRAFVIAISEGDPKRWATCPLARDVDSPVAMTVGLLERLLNGARNGAAMTAYYEGVRSGTEYPWTS